MLHVLVFFVLLVAVVIGFTLHSHFLRELRSRHPDVWESLGRPSLFMNNSVSNGWAVQRFLWRKDYERLDDPDLRQSAVVLRTYNIAYLALFVLLALCQIIYSVLVTHF